MAYAVRQAMHKIVDAVTDTTAFSGPSMATSAPSSQQFKCDHWRAARLFFLGTASADLTVNFRVVLWFRFKGQYLPVVIADGTYTLGSGTTGSATDIGAATTYVADTITLSKSAGAAAYSPENNTTAFLVINMAGAEYVTVETDLGSAASATVLFQAEDEPYYSLVAIS